jgi:thymidylate synthase (FAD)
MEELHDCLAGRNLLIDNLLDGKGSVQLVDVSPRMCPKGYGPEYMMVRAARTSFGLGLKDPVTDAKLLRYLLVNWHTSPTEMSHVTFRLVLPKDVAVHFLRHRHGSYNQFSQRYAEVKEEESFYDPTKYEHGIRTGTKLNQQSSVDVNNDTQKQSIKEKMEEANQLTRQIHKLYTEMIGLGLAKEIARFWLPSGEYTTLFCQFDLNNLMKMLTLRVDDHSQHETTVYARVMLELIRPLFPVCVEILEERMQGMFLMKSEIDVLIGNRTLESIVSVSERKALEEKLKRIVLESKY